MAIHQWTVQTGAESVTLSRVTNQQKCTICATFTFLYLDKREQSLRKVRQKSQRYPGALKVQSTIGGHLSQMRDDLVYKAFSVFESYL